MRKQNGLLLLSLFLFIATINPIKAENLSDEEQTQGVTHNVIDNATSDDFLTVDKIRSENFWDNQSLIETKDVQKDFSLQRSNIAQTIDSKYKVFYVNDDKSFQDVINNTVTDYLYVILENDISLSSTVVNKIIIPKSKNIVIDGYNKNNDTISTLTQNKLYDYIDISQQSTNIEFKNIKLSQKNENALVRSDKATNITYENVIFDGFIMFNALYSKVTFDNSQVFLQSSSLKNGAVLGEASNFVFKNYNDIYQKNGGVGLFPLTINEIIFEVNSNTYIQESSTVALIATVGNKFEVQEHAKLTIDSRKYDKGTNKYINFNLGSKLNIEENASLNMISEGRNPNQIRTGASLYIPLGDTNLMGTINVVHQGFKSDMFYGLLNTRGFKTAPGATFNAYIETINEQPTITASSVILGEFKTLNNIDIDFRTTSDISRYSEGIVRGSAILGGDFIMNDSRISVTAAKAQALLTGALEIEILWKPIISNSTFVVNTVESYDDQVLGFSSPGTLKDTKFYIKADSIDIPSKTVPINRTNLIQKHTNGDVVLNGIEIYVNVANYMNGLIMDTHDITLKDSVIDVKVGKNIVSKPFNRGFKSLNNSVINFEVGTNQDYQGPILDLKPEIDGNGIIDQSSIMLNFGGNVDQMVNSQVLNNKELIMNESHILLHANGVRNGIFKTKGNLSMVDSSFVGSLDQSSMNSTYAIETQKIESQDSNFVLDLNGDKAPQPALHIMDRSIKLRNENTKDYIGAFTIKVPKNSLIFDSNDSTSIDFTGQQVNVWYSDNTLDEESPDVRYVLEDQSNDKFIKSSPQKDATVVGFEQSNVDQPQATKFDLSDGSVQVLSMGNLYNDIDEALDLNETITGKTASFANNILYFNLDNSQMRQSTQSDQMGTFKFDKVNLLGSNYNVVSLKNYLIYNGQVKIINSGQVKVIKAPGNFVFSNLPLNAKETIYSRAVNNVISIIIEDTRLSKNWELTLTLDTDIIDSNTKKPISGKMIFKHKDGTVTEMEKGKAIPIAKGTDTNEVLRTLEWQANEGVLLKIKNPAEISILTSYEAGFTWTLKSK